MSDPLQELPRFVVRRLTNGAWVAGVIALGRGTRIGPFWTPVTSPAFDGGVIAVAPNGITMMWVEDED